MVLNMVHDLCYLLFWKLLHRSVNHGQCEARHERFKAYFSSSINPFKLWPGANVVPIKEIN